MYRQLGDINSQWHKKNAKSASWGKCQSGEVPVGEVPVGGLVPVGGQKFNPWTDDFFSNFVGGKNLTPFSALNDLQ